MGAEGPAKGVLDAGALIAIDRGDRSALGALVAEGAALIVPAAVLAQVWRDGSRQVRLARFLESEGTSIDELDEVTAKAAGRLLAHSGTTDVVDATVVIAARIHHACVVTGDAEDLRTLDPALDLRIV